MALLADLFNTTFRDYATDGVPATGEHYPQKRDIRALGQRIESLIGAAAGGLLYYSTRAQLFADRTQKVGQLAFVFADPVAANNGVYHNEATAWVVDTAYAQGIVAVAQATLNEALSKANAAARMAALSVANAVLTHDPRNASKSGRQTAGSAGATMFDPTTFGASGLLGVGVVDQITSYFEQPVNNVKYKILRLRRGPVNASNDPVSGGMYYDFVAETAPFNAVTGENVLNLDAASSLVVTPDCVLAVYTPTMGLSQAGGPPGVDTPTTTPSTSGTIGGDFTTTAQYAVNSTPGQSAWGYSASVRMLKCRLRWDGRLDSLNRLATAFPEAPTVRTFGSLGPDRMPIELNATIPAGDPGTWRYNAASVRSWLVPVDANGYLTAIGGYAAVAGATAAVVWDESGVVIFKEDFSLAATGRFRYVLKSRCRMRPNYRAGLVQSATANSGAGGGSAKFGFLQDGSRISHPLTGNNNYPPVGTAWTFADFEAASVAILLEMVPYVEPVRTTPRTTLSVSDRYVRGTDVLPVLTDTTRMAGWGSSTMDYLTPDLTGLALSLGASYFAGGRGGEQMQDHLARLGSHPAQLTGFQNAQVNTIRGNGATPVAASGAGTLPSRTGQNNLLPLTASLLAYTGSLVLPNGDLLAGTLQWNSAGYHEFVRRDAGADIVLGANVSVRFIPEIGNRYRDALNLLNIGKNNINDGGNAATAQDIVGRTHEAFDWLSPLIRRTIVINHFINTDMASTDPQYAKTLAVNAGLADRYGPLLLDVYGFVCRGLVMFGQTVWTASGVTPTSGDLAQQANGTKPSSLSRDALHMNDPAEVAVTWLLRQKMLSLGWF